MGEGSKCFKLTAVGAGAETELLIGAAGSTYNMPPGSWHIYGIRLGFANVVNAKESAGYLRVKVAGQSGDYYYAVGHGAGGATNTSGMAAQLIDCAINADGGALVQVYAYSSEATADWHVSLKFRSGSGRKVVTYKCGGAGTDVTAGTEKTIGTMTVNQGAGTIREIRFTGSGVVDALAETGRLILEVPGQEGIPHEYAVGHGTAGATLSATVHCDVIKLPVGIPVGNNAVITVKLLNFATTGSALLSCLVSIQVA